MIADLKPPGTPMFRHTPGPWKWRISKDSMRLVLYGNINPGSTYIVMKAQPYCSQCTAHAPGRLSDRRLIEKAPELLDAVKVLTTYLDAAEARLKSIDHFQSFAQDLARRVGEARELLWETTGVYEKEKTDA